MPRWLLWRRRSPTSQSLGTCSTIVRTVQRLSMTGFGLFLFSSVQHSRSHSGIVSFHILSFICKASLSVCIPDICKFGTPSHYLDLEKPIQAKIGKHCAFSIGKGYQLEKSTPPPVEAIVTNISYIDLRVFLPMVSSPVLV